MHEDVKQRWRKFGPEVRLILWAAWDPIDAGVPLDEYDSYVGPVWRLLEDGASQAEIAAHLGQVREERIGIGAASDDIRAAGKLRDWYSWRFEEES